MRHKCNKKLDKNISIAIITAQFNKNFTEQLELLNEVWSVFGQFSAWKLRDMSHNEKPWLDHEENASMIEDDELASYFKTRVK